MLIEQSQTNADHVQGPFVRLSARESVRVGQQLLAHYSHIEVVDMMLRSDAGMCLTVRSAVSGSRRFWYRYAR